MPQPHSSDADQLLDRIVTALCDEPIPEFHDPCAGNPATATPDAECAESPSAADQGVPAEPAEIEPLGARRVGAWARAAARWKVVASCTACVVLLVAAALVLKPRASFAEVQAAVLAQPWIHVRSVYGDQSTSETWFSPARNIAASRARGSVRYEDFRLGIYYSYDPEVQVLYRGPIAERTTPTGEFESIGEAIQVLLRGNGPPEKPLAHMGFLGAERDKLTVLDQRVDKVTEQDRTWLDYRLTVRHTELAEPVQLLFRVDTGTKLPHLCRAVGRHDDKPFTFEVRFDFPEKGPADIYELGVPAETKLVDRVPSGDLKLIVKALQAGRERMDNYRSVFVTQSDDADESWWRAFPEIFCRKGDRYRRDFVVPDGRPNEIARPAADADRRQWWLERASLLRYYPTYVQLGPTSYTGRTREVVDPDGSKHLEFEKVDKYVYNLKPGELFPVDYVMRPEFVCRPPMGIGNPNQEPTLDLHPMEGPDGCILLTVRNFTKAAGADAKGIALARADRYWLDPRRDYIVMRWESVMQDGSGKEVIGHCHIVEETARSPQGVWYATKVRLKDASVRQSDGKQFDQIYHIYVDFDADLPDRLFAPLSPRRIE